MSVEKFVAWVNFDGCLAPSNASAQEDLAPFAILVVQWHPRAHRPGELTSLPQVSVFHLKKWHCEQFKVA
jgi:hypothetical protein